MIKINTQRKHESYDLAQMQSLPLKAKIMMSKQRIKAWYEHYDGDVYVSVSGGKDSQVLAHLVKSIYSDVPLVFVNTGLEYDSVREKGMELADKVLVPEMNFVNVIKKYGYPVISKEISLKVSEVKSCPNGYASQSFDENSKKNKKYPQYSMVKYRYLLDAPFRISHKCCDVMKKRTANKLHAKPYIGTLASESRLRKNNWMKYGCNAFEKGHPSSQPLSFWTEQDILQYIKQYKIDIADIYGDIVYVCDDGMVYDDNIFDADMKLKLTGVQRTGCVFCMFGINYDKERFLRLKEVEPNKYKYMMQGGEFDAQGLWIPTKPKLARIDGKIKVVEQGGLGYKFVIDWLNEHGDMGIKY